MNGKRHDFIKTCVDKKTAESVLEIVLRNYGSNPNWKVGENKIEPVSNGEYKVTVELTFYEYGMPKEENSGMKM